MRGRAYSRAYGPYTPGATGRGESLADPKQGPNAHHASHPLKQGKGKDGEKCNLDYGQEYPHPLCGQTRAEALSQLHGSHKGKPPSPGQAQDRCAL